MRQRRVAPDQLPMAFIPLPLILACLISWTLIAYAAAAIF